MPSIIVKILHSRIELSKTSPYKMNTYKNKLKSQQYHLNTFHN